MEEYEGRKRGKAVNQKELAKYEFIRKFVGTRI